MTASASNLASSLLLAMALVGCQGQPVAPAGKRASAAPRQVTTLTPPPGVGSTPVPTPTTALPSPTATAPAPPPLPTVLPTPASPELAALAGLVLAPAALVANNGGGLLSDQGGAIIANNGGGILSNNGGGLVSDQGGSLIANNGSGILSNNSGSYRLQATGDVGLAGAFLYLTDRDERFYLDSQTQQVLTAGTDAKGAYAFVAPGFPVGKDVIVNAVLFDNQRLTGFLKPQAGRNALDIGLATTLCTELLRAEAARQGRALSSFDPAAFDQTLAATRSALASGALPTTKTVNGSPAAAFDLRLERLARLRGQLVIAFSAAESANAPLHALSDAWRKLLGHRPMAVTTLLGSGAVPVVNSQTPHADGDGVTPALAAPLGYCQGVAIAAAGDVLFTSEANESADGHVRWLQPGGKLSTVWFPTFRLEQPGGLAIERQPGADMATAPGSVLVAGNTANFIVRSYLVDHALALASGAPAFPQELVAGEYTPLSSQETSHPALVDGPAAPIDTSAPLTSYWRLADEGPRTYASTGQPVPTPARYAHVNHPQDVTLDELGNIYFADTWNQRIRMIPRADSSAYGYRLPLDADHDGQVDGFGAPATLKAGCLYTIAGNPSWDAARTADHGGHWFGEFAGDGGPAQAAKLAGPVSLAFHAGYLYLADQDNQRIRRISRATGVIETVAGSPPGPQTHNGSYYFYPRGTAGDGGPAATAQLGAPQALAFDPRGRLYFFDAGSQRVRMVDLTTDQRPLTTVAGHLPDPLADFGALGSDGDALWGVTLQDVRGIASDGAGNLLLSDFGNRRLRRLWRQWE